MAAVLSVTATVPAHAVAPGDVVSAGKTAYEVFQKLFGNQLTLEQATDQIVAAIGQARSDIETHIDQIAVAEVQACSRAAVGDLVDIDVLAMDQASLISYAWDASECAERAVSQVSQVEAGAPVDQFGYILNAVAPIALYARTAAGLSVDTLRADVISGNQTVVSRLTPSCTATPLWADAEPGGPVEVQLTCFGYNRNGFDWVYAYLRRDNPLPTFDYTTAIEDATQYTSRPFAEAALVTV